jgi:hypothetical protein
VIRSPRHPLAFILLLHLTLSLWYSTTLPILEGEDEAAHFAYLRYLSRERRLPPISLDIIQAYHPPLYYTLGALLTFWIPESGLPAKNPYWGYDTYRFGVDNKNIYIHSPIEESFPYRGTALAVHVARWLSILFGMGTVFIVYATAREAFPERLNLALAASAFAAFLPAYLSSVSVVSNDSLAALLGSAIIFLTARGVRRGLTNREALLIGLLGGLLLLNKLSTAFVLVPTLLVVAFNGFPHSRNQVSWRNLVSFLKRLTLTLTPLFLLPLPWFFRNLLAYGELTNVRELDRVLGVLRKTPLTFPQFLENAQVGFNRFWVQFGIGQIVAPGWVYILTAALTLLAFVGLMRWWLFSNDSLLITTERNPAIVLTAFALLALIAVLIYITLNVHGAQTRLFMFPALPAAAPLLVIGWTEWIPQKWRPHALLPFVIAMIVFAIGNLLGVLRPAFARPLLASNEPLPITPFETPIRFENSVELLGAQVTPGRAAPGDELTARLCWRVLNATATNLSLFVHLIDSDLNKIGERETYPGLGRLPSIYWSAGDRFCDDVHIRVKDWGGGPALLPLVVGYFDEGGALTVYSADQKLDLVIAGRVAVLAKSPPDTAGMTATTQFTLGEAVDLIGYQWLPSPTGEAASTLRLFWRARESVSEDYIVFVHWLAEDGTFVAQNDTPPRNGMYPTSAWAVGEIVADDHPLTPTAPLSGPTRVEVGLYLPITGERLGDMAITFPGP